MEKICVLGSGTWGTALVNLLANHDYDVTLWSKFKEEVDALASTLTHKNLPGAKLNKNIHFSDNLEESIMNKDVIVFAMPSLFIRESAKVAKRYLKPSQVIVNVAKGIEEDTLLTMSEILEDELGEEYQVVTLSGPSHAEEVARELPTCVTATSKSRDARKYIQKIFSNGVFRVYTNSDTKGVEISAALKNIIALSCGISDGLGYGDNAKAALITRGLFEITNLGKALNCDLLTFSGLSGIGDIVVTSTSNFSRNHNCGVLIGKGVKPKDAIKQIGMVVEGINCLKSAHQIMNKYNVEMPIVDTVYKIVYEDKDPLEMTKLLFDRPLIGEKVFHN